MKRLSSFLAFVLALVALAPAGLFASSHREAPISALDHGADVTDWYAFVSYDHPDRVTMILNVDGFLEPSNGPNYFPFDPNVKFVLNVDNNQDGKTDISFEFRFKTETRQPGVFTGFVGGIGGFPPITALEGPGSQGLSLRQTYTVTMIKNGVATNLAEGRTLYAVPSNVGPLTMPRYRDLFNQGIYDLGDGVRVFAGTVDDPFYIDLGAAFDSFSFRMNAGGILSPAHDADDTHNYAPDAVAGFNVNSIVLEVPIAMLTMDGKLHGPGEKQAVIGTYGETDRQRITVRYHLTPLSREETGRYIAHRLRVAGAKDGHPSFTPWAIWAIHRYSSGIPRLINAICDKALLYGFVNGTANLTARRIRQAARELEGKVA